MSEDCLPITLEFSGGAELLFGNKKEMDIQLKPSKIWTVKDLLPWMKENVIGERPELFFQGESVRPGILVLINDTDWELMDQLNYELKKNDRVMFISTLHGG